MDKSSDERVPDPVLGSQQPLAMLQAWGKVAGKLPFRMGPGCAG